MTSYWKNPPKTCNFHFNFTKENYNFTNTIIVKSFKFREIIILPDSMFLIRSWYLLHWKTWFVIFMQNAVINLEGSKNTPMGLGLTHGAYSSRRVKFVDWYFLRSSNTGNIFAQLAS